MTNWQPARGTCRMVPAPMQQTPSTSLVRFRDLAGLARALFVVGFVVDAFFFIGFDFLEALREVEVSMSVNLVVPKPTPGEIFLAIASACALALALRRAALEARPSAPRESVLWKLGFAHLLPWNFAGKEALHEVWRRSAPPSEAEPPVALHLLWWAWSCWLPLALIVGIYAAMTHARSNVLAYAELQVAAVHAVLCVCAVLVLGAFGRHQATR